MTEVTLSCMVVEPRTKVVPITIDPRKNLIYLSVAIKKAFWCELYGEAPLDLGLYLATRGDVWLTRDDPEIKALEAGEEAPDVIKEIVETTVDMARIETIGDCLVGSGLPPPPSNQVHFLVDVIPYNEELARAAHKAVFPRAKLCWNEPRPLVEHPSWDIQHEAYEERSLWAMGPHYNTWKEERTSRHNNPVFYCVGGSKAGKSRLLDEFQHLLQVRVANRDTKYAARDVMIRDAFVFKISFSREKMLPAHQLDLLIDYMGGFPGALAILLEVLHNTKDVGKPFTFEAVLRAVVSELHVVYPSISIHLPAMIEAFLAVIRRDDVTSLTKFGETCDIVTMDASFDEAFSCGLLRLNVDERLECPYVLYLLLDSLPNRWDEQENHAPRELRGDWKPWVTWNEFYSTFRVLKSLAWADRKDHIG
ncbi:hypothetical protein Poli38472_001850 [Pythium oligandrum]|uniref:Crinkler effector protein N-terminal domain-containing protein n=1 Tax=Pythium oligandrum TaxID=41045 RepID=A0A8K1CUW7_PYTOL|nr:hypothetical protein Poli38472_001850 [Pythium oligandrum]|eukprot:TMW69694.1 hypothetical protein Poli38472_001850 [Pythium oligandrum]